MISILLLTSTLTFCEIQANYIDHVVENIHAGRTMLHAKVLELSKTGDGDIVERLYAGLVNGDVDDVVGEIKSECK